MMGSANERMYKILIESASHGLLHTHLALRHFAFKVALHNI